MEFLQKFSANPAAVAFANWQISQYYESAATFESSRLWRQGASQLSAQSNSLVSQASIAQQMKDSVEYHVSIRGGEAYNSIAKQPKPSDMSDADFATRVQDEKNLQIPAMNLLKLPLSTPLPRRRTPRPACSSSTSSAWLPNSRFIQEVGSRHAGIVELKNPARAAAYGRSAPDQSRQSAHPDSTGRNLCGGSQTGQPNQGHHLFSEGD